MSKYVAGNALAIVKINVTIADEEFGPDEIIQTRKFGQLKSFEAIMVKL